MAWFEYSVDNTQPPAFSDVAGARAWLAQQPQAMPAKMLEALSVQLERLASVGAIDAFVRASIVEALRAAIHTAEAAERKRFAYQPRPLSSEQNQVFLRTQRLWLALAGNYLQCLEAYGAQQPVNKTVAGTAAHRALVSLRQSVEVAFAAGVAPAPALWWHLHRVAQVVAHLGLNDVAVVDPEFPLPATTTPSQQYLMAVLLTILDPYRWTPGQYAVAHRAFSRWRDLATLAPANDNNPMHRWVPLSLLPPLPPGLDKQPPAWAEVHLIRRKLKKRIEAIDAGATPEKLKLGRELSPAACRALLVSLADRLRAAYSGAVPAEQPVGVDCRLALGTDAAWEALAGRPFKAVATLNAVSARILHERIAMFGQSSAAEEADVRVEGGEVWRLESESIEAADVSRAADDPGARLLPGGVAVITAEHSTSLAHITRVWVDGKRALHARVRRFPGVASASIGRAPKDPNAPGFPVFRLPAVDSLGTVASVILPSGVALRLRGKIEALDAEGWQAISLGPLIERGADFERFELAGPA